MKAFLITEEMEPVAVVSTKFYKTIADVWNSLPDNYDDYYFDLDIEEIEIHDTLSDLFKPINNRL